MMKKGYWWLKSKIDPRWNCGGEGIVGGFVKPPEVEKKLEELRELYGEPPEDLEWGYHKY